MLKSNMLVKAQARPKIDSGGTIDVTTNKEFSCKLSLTKSYFFFFFDKTLTESYLILRKGYFS